MSDNWAPIRYGEPITHKTYGWLAPNGDLHPCSYWRHEALERAIREQMAIPTPLIKQGWIYVGTTDEDKCVRPTQPQINVMGELLMAPLPGDMTLMHCEPWELMQDLLNMAIRHDLPIGADDPDDEDFILIVDDDVAEGVRHEL